MSHCGVHHQDLNYTNYRLEKVKMLQHTATQSMGIQMLKTSSQSNNHCAKCTSEKPQ